MKADELREMYLSFFKSKGHVIIPSASLIPQDDPSVLFTTAGMHPLVPYLLGEPHPAGKRLCNFQKCIRTGDIDSVGDACHLTFFEMLGNWSLGDYFKEEAISWSYEFLTSKSYLGISPEKLYVTVFAGNSKVKRDDDSIKIWRKLGIPDSHIFPLSEKDNWWGPPGETGPCGPDTEMFIDTGKSPCSEDCRPGCSCGKYFEIWNDVFMQYRKNEDGDYELLKQHNVDTGMGVERTIAVMQGKNSVYETEVFYPILEVIRQLSKISGSSEKIERSFRIIADHIKSAVFILGDENGITPGNLGQGYVLRRLIRRAIRHGRLIGIKERFTARLVDPVISIYAHVYPELEKNRKFIVDELEKEEVRFERTLDRGLVELERFVQKLKENKEDLLQGKDVFKLYDTYGFPVEFTAEICAEHGIRIDYDGFKTAFDRHKQISREGVERVFRGGLGDTSEKTVKLHTATHLLHRSLQLVLGDHVKQKGSNITPERLRFDFSHPDRLTAEEIKKVEDLVNEKIKEDLPVTYEIMTLEEAKKQGAVALFESKYGEKVKVYSIGTFSKEVCGGPHVVRTGVLGRFRIIKESSAGSGIRRIKAILEDL